AVPQFVIDAPGGGGKVPINPGYVLYHDNEKIVIRNYEGKIFDYPETGNEQVQLAPQRETPDESLSPYHSHPSRAACHAELYFYGGSISYSTKVAESESGCF